jgi:predicted HTH transcriptional regulator
LLGENHILQNREMHVQFVKPVNDPVKTKNDPVNDLVKRSIMQHLKLNPRANYSKLADKTAYSTATIKRHIQELKKMGIIERIGSDKTGYWKIIE